MKQHYFSLHLESGGFPLLFGTQCGALTTLMAQNGKCNEKPFITQCSCPVAYYNLLDHSSVVPLSLWQTHCFPCKNDATFFSVYAETGRYVAHLFAVELTFSDKLLVESKQTVVSRQSCACYWIHGATKQKCRRPSMGPLARERGASLIYITADAAHNVIHYNKQQLY